MPCASSCLPPRPGRVNSRSQGHWPTSFAKSKTWPTTPRVGYFPLRDPSSARAVTEPRWVGHFLELPRVPAWIRGWSRRMSCVTRLSLGLFKAGRIWRQSRRSAATDPYDGPTVHARPWHPYRPGNHRSRSRNSGTDQERNSRHDYTKTAQTQRSSLVTARPSRCKAFTFSISCDWRPGPESNRCGRICSPLHSHSATRPRLWAAWYRRVTL